MRKEKSSLLGQRNPFFLWGCAEVSIHLFFLEQEQSASPVLRMLVPSPWYKDTQLRKFLAVVGVYQSICLLMAVDEALRALGELTGLLIFPHPVFAAVLPLQACRKIPSTPRAVMPIVLNAACTVPLLIMPGNISAGRCLVYLLPQLAFGLSVCLLAFLLRRQSSGRNGKSMQRFLLKLMAGFLLNALCFYAWAPSAFGSLTILFIYLIDASFFDGAITSTFGELIMVPLGVFAVSVVTGICACAARRRKEKVKEQ
jgi:hypothetical protein